MSILKVIDYIKEHRDDLVLMILLADKGGYELLAKYFGEKEGFHALKEAQRYGALVKHYTPADYPIAVCQNTGEITKMPYRIAGLVIAKQKYMMVIKCGLPVAEKPTFNFSKEDKKTLDDFYLILTGDPPTAPNPVVKDSPALPVHGPALKEGKKAA